MSESNYKRGQFIWHELLTPDVDAAKKFYGELFGWTFTEGPMPDGNGVYTEVRVGEKSQAGMLPLTMLGKEGVPPHWMPYVSIADVDEAVSAAKDSGGTVSLEPMDIPKVGRMAGIGDPQHAYTSCINMETGDPKSDQQPGVGQFCWDQLNTSDVAGAAAFYAKVYGWEKKDFPHGGDFWVFHAGETSVASVMKAPEGVPSHWITYVVVENQAAARDKVGELGGQVMMPEIPVPGVGTIAVISDNAGAVIGLFEAPSEG